MVIVEVPAGKFNCIHYQHRKGPDKNHITYEDIYFAVGIGVVKRIGYSFTDEGVRYKAGETELTSYTLQPD